MAYTVSELASMFRGRIDPTSPNSDTLNDMSDEQFLTYIMDNNPEARDVILAKVDFNSLGSGLKTFAQQTRPAPYGALQVLSTMAEAAVETVKDPETWYPQKAYADAFRGMLEDKGKSDDEKKLASIQRTDQLNADLNKRHKQVIEDASSGKLFKWADAKRKAAHEAGQAAIRKDPQLQAYNLWLTNELESATFTDYFKPRMVGALVGQGLPTLLGGIGLYAGGNMIAPGVGGALAFAGMFGLEGGLQYNDVYEDLKNDPRFSEEEARALANFSGMQTGLINAMLENLRLGSFFKRFGLGKQASRNLQDIVLKKTAEKAGGMNKLAKMVDGSVDNYDKFRKTMGGKIFIDAIQEGTEEWAQGINQRVSELGFDNHTIGEILGGEPGSPALAEFFGGFYGGSLAASGAGIYASGYIPKTKPHEQRIIKKASKELTKLN